jgi:hypothetical protein
MRLLVTRRRRVAWPPLSTIIAPIRSASIGALK